MLKDKTVKEGLDVLFFTLELLQQKQYTDAEIVLGDFIKKHREELIKVEIDEIIP